MFTKQHYKKIASEFRKLRIQFERYNEPYRTNVLGSLEESIIPRFITIFMQDNSKFDFEKFNKAIYD